MLCVAVMQWVGRLTGCRLPTLADSVSHIHRASSILTHPDHEVLQLTEVGTSTCSHQRSGRRRYVSRVFVRACVRSEQTLLAQYLGYMLTKLVQTFTTNGLLGKDECVKFWGQKVKVMVGSNALFGLVVSHVGRVIITIKFFFFSFVSSIKTQVTWLNAHLSKKRNLLNVCEFICWQYFTLISTWLYAVLQ